MPLVAQLKGSAGLHVMMHVSDAYLGDQNHRCARKEPPGEKIYYFFYCRPLNFSALHQIARPQMLTYERSKVSISVLPPRKLPRTKMLNLGVLRYRNREQASAGSFPMPAIFNYLA